MITTISKTFDFDAAHSLPLLPSTHKCHRLHGHTYRVEIRLTAILDEMGMVLDYDELAAWWAPLHAQLDHRHLNEIDGLGTPTTEVLAAWIYARLKASRPDTGRWASRTRTLVVRVYESSTTWAEVGG